MNQQKKHCQSIQHWISDIVAQMPVHKDFFVNVLNTDAEKIAFIFFASISKDTLFNELKNNYQEFLAP
jgi:hypothetical protein